MAPAGSFMATRETSIASASSSFAGRLRSRSSTRRRTRSLRCQRSFSSLACVATSADSTVRTGAPNLPARGNSRGNIRHGQ